MNMQQLGNDLAEVTAYMGVYPSRRLSVAVRRFRQVFGEHFSSVDDVLAASQADDGLPVEVLRAFKRLYDKYYEHSKERDFNPGVVPPVTQQPNSISSLYAKLGYRMIRGSIRPSLSTLQP